MIRVTCDQCLYGCEAENGDPIKKPTSFMTNAPELAKELSDRCGGRGGACSRLQGGTHGQCRGKTARLAAMHHFKLCRAISVGFRRQLQHDGICKDGFVGMLESGLERTEVKPLPILQLGCADCVYNVEADGEKIFNDLTGQILDSKLVKEARKKELDFFESKGVWVKKAMDEARRVTGKPPITVRWVDVNKGDDLVPLAARQIR